MRPLIRLLALDLDGTLLDPQFQISAENQAALRRAHEAGIEIALCTGRRHAFALPIAESLGFDVILVSSNGAMTKSMRGELFHKDPLPADVARRLLQYMAEFRRYALLTFDREARGALVVETAEELNGSIGRWMEKNAAFIQRVNVLEDALTEDPLQVMFCGAVSTMQQAEERMAVGEIAAEITVHRTRYDYRNLCILDVLNRQCSKGHAVKRWAEYRGLSRDQVMAIGDNYNDKEMLEFAGFPFIMGNASEDLKHNGWAVTLSNDQSGVAAAIAQVGI